MTDREYIKSVASEAGWPSSLIDPIIMDKLVAFYNVAFEAGRVAENEACAKAYEELAENAKNAMELRFQQIAVAIRERRNK